MSEILRKIISSYRASMCDEVNNDLNKNHKRPNQKYNFDVISKAICYGFTSEVLRYEDL